MTRYLKFKNNILKNYILYQNQKFNNIDFGLQSFNYYLEKNINYIYCNKEKKDIRLSLDCQKNIKNIADNSKTFEEINKHYKI